MREVDRAHLSDVTRALDGIGKVYRLVLAVDGIEFLVFEGGSGPVGQASAVQVEDAGSNPASRSNGAGAAHAHHWKIEAPNGPTSSGACVCGETRVFANSGAHPFVPREGKRPGPKACVVCGRSRRGELHAVEGESWGSGEA